ncbi:MAG: WXG100 family type VII secretion target, partial [Saccharothrix sp.]|nr:WXG100 family type VII secretion target [Saccharothrix sp.]
MTTQATTQGRDPSHLIGDIQGTVSAVERGDWVQAGLGMANTAMGIVGLASNPLSGFLSAGFSWAIQHVSFLREPFDALLGNPQAIQKMSDSWASAAKQIEGIVADYRRTSVEETRNWRGRSADGYRAASKKHAAGLETLSKATQGISRAAKGAGELVATVRKTIMDLISQAVSDMVMKIIQWLAASFLTFGAAIAGAIADIVQMACNYAKKLADFLQKLGNSLKKLIDLIKSVAQIAQTAKQILQAITAMTSSNKGTGGGGAGPRLTQGGVGLDERQLNQMDRDTGQRFTNPGGNTNTSGSGGGGGAGGPVVSRPPQVGVPVGEYPGSGGGGGGYGPGGPVVARPPSVGGGGGGGGGGGYRPGITPPPGYATPGGGDPRIELGPGGGSGGPGGSGGHWEPGRWVPDPPSGTPGGWVPTPSVPMPTIRDTTYATGSDTSSGVPTVP